MGVDKAQLESILKAFIDAEKGNKPPDDINLCGCGTINDAMKTAERIITSALGSDCPVWHVQVAQAYAMMATYALIHHGDLDLQEAEKYVTGIKNELMIRFPFSIKELAAKLEEME